MTNEKQTLLIENDKMINILKETEQKKQYDKKEIKKKDNEESYRFINFSNELSKYFQNLNLFRVFLLNIYYNLIEKKNKVSNCEQSIKPRN